MVPRGHARGQHLRRPSLPDPLETHAMFPRSTARRRGGWFTDRSVGTKIGAAVALLAIVVLATNALAILRIQDLRDGQEQIYSENLQPLNALSAVQRANAAYRARVLEYAVSDAARRQELLGEMAEKNADLEAALAEYTPFVVDEAAMKKFDDSRTQFLSTNQSQLFPAADSGNLVAYAQIYRDVSSPLLSDLADGLEEEGVAQSKEAAA